MNMMASFALDQQVIEAIAEEVAARVYDRRDQYESAWLGVKGAAEYLATTDQAIRGLVKRDAIPVHKAPNGRLLFDRDELNRWVRSN